MRVFGRQISKWRLLLLVPVVVGGLPFLLILNNFAGAILGPPAIWDVPYHHPSLGNLAGKYVETERHWDRAKAGPNSELELKSDGSMTVNDLPQDSGSDICTLSGSGTWSAPGGQ